MINKCKLCGTEGELILSHIIPSSIFKWLKETSATGYMRRADTPNLRTQDGLKEYWLCKKCEKLFNAWETKFSNNIFYPTVETKQFKQLKYDDWLLKFCVSLNWRVLLYYKEKTNLAHLTAPLRLESDKALETWAEYLLSKRPNPGKYECHLIPINAITNFSYPSIPTNINRYLLRNVHIDIPCNDKQAFVYIKLPFFIQIGFINVSHPELWKRTLVHVNNGILGSRKYILPASLGAYINDRAHRIKQALRNISEKQQDKINQSILKNPDKFVSSETYKAMNHDVELFGKDAFDE